MAEEVLALRARVLGAVESSEALKRVKGQIDLFGKTDAMRKVNADLSNLNRQFGSVSSIAGTAAGSIISVGTGAITAAASMAKFVGSMNDLQTRMSSLKFLSDQTGVAADKIEQLSIAAKKLGVAPEAVSAAFAKMSRESIDITRNTSSLLGEIRAAEGGKYANFADQLRKDGRDVQKLVSDTLKFLSQIPDGEKRAVWAEKLLGSSEFAKLFPKGNSAEFDKALADAGKDSKLVTERLLQQAERYRKAKAELDQDIDDFTMRVAPRYFAAVSGLLHRLGKFLSPDEAAVAKSQAAGGARGEIERLLNGDGINDEGARARLRAYEKKHPNDKSSFEYGMLKGNVDDLEKRLAKASKEGTKEGVQEGMKAMPKSRLDPRGEALGKYAPTAWPGGPSASSAGGGYGAPGTPRLWMANWGGTDVRGGYGYGGGGFFGTPAGPRSFSSSARRSGAQIRDGMGTPSSPSGSNAHNLTALIDREAKAAGVDPRILHGIRAGESGRTGAYDHNAGTPDRPEDSWGPFQLNRRGGLGTQFEKETGLDLSNPKTIAAQVRWVSNYIKKHGRGALGQWHGYHGDRDADPKWGDAGYKPDKSIAGGRRGLLARLAGKRGYAGSSAEYDKDISGDISGQSTYSRKGEAITPEAFVVHHTGGRGTPEGVMNTFNQRGYPAQYIMDRDGKIVRALPEGTRGAHVLSGNEAGFHVGNDNALGMEVIAKDDRDVTPAQVAAARKFYRDLKAKYPTLKGAYGHGFLNPGHKQATEGKTIADAIRADENAPAQPAADPARAGRNAAKGVPVAQRGFLGGAYRGEGDNAFSKPLRPKEMQHKVDTSGHVSVSLNVKGLPGKVSSQSEASGIVGGVRVIHNGSHMPVAANH